MTTALLALAITPLGAFGGFSPDADFGQSGVTHLVRYTGPESITAITVQPDGAIVGTGGAITSGDDMDLVVMRLDPQGRLDESFGTGGVTTVDPSGAYDVGTSIVSTADGGFVVAGYTGDRGLVVRLGADGRRDTDFGDGGIAIIEHPSVSLLEFNDVAVDAAGRILTSGRYTFLAGGEFPDQSFLAVRLTGEGELDSGFGDGGFVVIDGAPAEATALVVEPDDGVTLAGDSEDGIIFARVDAEGRLDEGFGLAGIAEVRVEGGAIIQALARTSGGRYLASLLQGQGVVAVGSDGRMESGFGDGGRVTVDGGIDLHALAETADGRIFLAGARTQAGDPATQDFFVGEVGPDGRLGSTGSVDVGGLRQDAALSMELDPQGRPVLGGFAFNGADRDFAFVRFSVEDADGGEAAGQESSPESQSSAGAGSSSSGSSGSSDATAESGVSSDGGGGSLGPALILLMTLVSLLNLRRSPRHSPTQTTRS